MPIIVKKLLNASLERVWEAITNPVQMRQWYFPDMPDFKPDVGFTTSFVMKSDEKNTFTALWEITEVVQFKKIAYNWRYEEFEGKGSVAFLLSPEKDKTWLALIQEGLETFPQNIPDFTKESCLAGWEYFIQNKLPGFLDNSA